jgi:hypothetical protein
MCDCRASDFGQSGIDISDTYILLNSSSDGHMTGPVVAERQFDPSRWFSLLKKLPNNIGRTLVVCLGSAAWLIQFRIAVVLPQGLLLHAR